MNQELTAALAEKNSEDIATIINKIGIATLMALLPNFLNILKTIQSETPPKAPTAG